MCCLALAMGPCVTLYLYEEYAVSPLASPPAHPPPLPSSPPSPPPYFKPIVPTVTLNNGVAMPMISLGTWHLTGNEGTRVTQLALHAGFNHIDTAATYQNQDAIGVALRGVERDSFFITTKVYPRSTDPSVVYNETMQLLHIDLSLLNLSYVDLVLIHKPGSGRLHCEVDQEGWRALEDFYQAGKARAIGCDRRRGEPSTRAGVPDSRF